jgi:hypothetical protein
MFERNRSPNSVERGRIAVTITLATGETMGGHIYLPASVRLADFLNNGQAFIEFEPRDEPVLLIGKQAVRSVSQLNVPKADQLSQRSIDLSNFDPHTILGVERGAGPEALRVAYYALARAYHPDRFGGLDLPKEMQAYANAMLARINMAYRALSGSNAVPPAAA